MPLTDDLLDRLEADESLEDRLHDLVLAALTDDVASVLDGVELRTPERTPDEEAEPKGAWLRSIEVEGFRGIGRSTSLDLDAGPGLHVVCGRNGSGKSSFSEALELLLTDSCSRWADRRKTWREAWQNLHHDGPTRIAAEVAIDGHARAVRLEGEWDPGSDPDERRLDRVAGSGDLSKRADLGWAGGFETWRPFLSYNELGNLLEESPTQIHDALAAVLGLEPLADAIARLETVRKDLRKVPKQARDELKVLRGRLGELDDERARVCLEALPEKRNWKLEPVEDLVTGSGPEPRGVERLRDLSTLRPVDGERLDAVVEALRQAATRLEEARQDRDTALSLRVAQLLEGATDWYDRSQGESGECPVCQTPDVLDDAWRAEAEARAEELRTRARKIQQAQKGIEDARSAARVLIQRSLELTAEDEQLVGWEVAELRDAWKDFREPASQDPRALADHLAEHGLRVRTASQTLRQAAQAKRDERANAWRPVAVLLGSWLGLARRAQAAERDQKELKQAADWLSAVEEELRNERFEPIKERAREIWELLRARSNVSLDDLRFAGKRTRRHLQMEVSVDGNAGVALGVMSQGELHSLALSLFLPRATLPQSPFRFLLIDDPVQAMDPIKVEGLARVLESVAATHQVVVFSHDDRLSEAVQRLGIEARILEVHRRPGSIVEVRSHLDPVERLFSDAHALVRDDGLPEEVRDRVVPGLCRQALEARVHEVVRNRRLSRGEGHREVETLLADARLLVPTLALALFDDPDRGGEVYRELGSRAANFGPKAVDVVKACNRGSHDASIDAAIPFVRAAEKLDAGLKRLS